LPWRRQLNPHSTPGTPAPAGGHLGAPRLAGEGIGGGPPRSRRTQP
jgi:hypothetical protein